VRPPSACARKPDRSADLLIDVHSHYMPRALERALVKREVAPRIMKRDGVPYVLYGEGSGTPLKREFLEPDLILEGMEQAHINHAVLSVTIPGVDWLEPAEAEAVAGEANEQTAAIVQQHPDRFSGLATVPMQSPERSITVLERALDMGLKGAMIYSNVAGRHLDEASRRVFFDLAAARAAPVMLHPTYPLCAKSVNARSLMEMAGFLFDTTTAALRLVLDGLYERHPDFKFFVPHTGSFIPYFTGRIDLVAAARPGARGEVTGAPSDHIKKFYVDTVTGSPLSVRYCCDFFGIDHVMHGTDHPFFPMSSGPELLDMVGLSAGDRARVEHLNAARFFDLNLAARQG
jgi:aminocarboxymuconate-semialdehyde decarboxylase